MSLRPHGTIIVMVRNTLIMGLVIAGVAIPSVSHGQTAGVLSTSDEFPVPGNTTTVRLGTTTIDVAFESARLESVERQLQEIARQLQASRNQIPATGVSTYTPIVEAAFAQVDSTPGVAGGVGVGTVVHTTLRPGDFCDVFTRTLVLGDTGPEVRTLQRFLNAIGVGVAQSGAGAPGEETEFFGSRTLQALNSFQERFKEHILVPLNLPGATGVWGPSSRAHARVLSDCTQ